MQIPFHRSLVTGSESKYIDQALNERHFSGNGPMTKRCQDWLTKYSGVPTVLTTSGTSSLDMIAMMMDLKPGDEVIMPSYTFVATASAFALRGLVPVFVDIRPDTLNIDETQIEAAITPKTKAIVPIHYAGVSAEMDTILNLAKKNGLMVAEDAAQCLLSEYRGRVCGTLGDLGTLSFHATKNVHCGEAGAIFINKPQWHLRAEIVREKGTNRSQFFRGEVDRYTWVELGSAFCPSELDAAFLLGQLEHVSEITTQRLKMWNRYQQEFKALEDKGFFRRPVVPDHCKSNAHIYFVILQNNDQRQSLMNFMKERQIGLSSHYVPLHSSPAGKKFGRASGTFKNTDDAFNGLLRFPLWAGLEEHQEKVIQSVFDWAKMA